MVDWEVLNARFRKRQAAQRPPAFCHEVAFKVPPYLKQVKPSQYMPHTVSLGLNMRLEPGMEDYKAEFQRCFVRWNNHSLETSTPPSARPPRSPSAHRYGRNRLAIDAVDYTSASAYKWDQFISDLKLDTDVKTANRWYEIDSSPVQPDILKSFLALDALFLALFLRYSCDKIPELRLPSEVFAELAEPVFRLLAEAPAGIWRDVFLLENQIPLHILRKVWVLMPDMKPGVHGRTPHEAERLFNKLLIEVVKDRYLKLFESSDSHMGERFVSRALSDKIFVECDHLLHCFHYATCYSPSPSDGDKPVRIFTGNESGTSPANTIPSATQLKKVGIRLNSDGCSFISQIKFEDSFRTGPVLTIPRLFISNETDSLLRNLAVFELVSGYQFPCQSLGPRLSTVTSFLFLLDKLIQQKSDVKLLRGDGIITSSVGNNTEVCEMWTTLCNGFSSYQHPEWVEMLKKLTTRYRSRRHQLLAEFKDKYFARPWVVVSWVGAIIFLILQGLQTLFAVVAYFWPPPSP